MSFVLYEMLFRIEQPFCVWNLGGGRLSHENGQIGSQRPTNFTVPVFFVFVKCSFHLGFSGLFSRDTPSLLNVAFI